MPELPEVETIRRQLDRTVPPARIRRVVVGLPKIVKLPLSRFRRLVEGATIQRFSRRAKLLLVGLSSGWTMIIHLKMSGQLIWQPRRGRLVAGGHPIPGGLDALPNKYSHVVFITNCGTLFFNDQRQFGYVRLVKTAELEFWLESQGFGPEPLSREFTLEVFQHLLRLHRRKRVKPMLLDQRVVAGVGNIYADEACFYARIRPARRIARLTRLQRQALYRGLRQAVALGIRQQGTTLRSFRMADGRPGRMRPFLKVYGRAGKQCYRCQGIIVKTVLAGRGTHFCPQCQD